MTCTTPPYNSFIPGSYLIIMGEFWAMSMCYITIGTTDNCVFEMHSPHVQVRVDNDYYCVVSADNVNC